MNHYSPTVGVSIKHLNIRIVAKSITNLFLEISKILDSLNLVEPSRDIFVLRCRYQQSGRCLFFPTKNILMRERSESVVSHLLVSLAADLQLLARSLLTDLGVQLGGDFRTLVRERETTWRLPVIIMFIVRNRRQNYLNCTIRSPDLDGCYLLGTEDMKTLGYNPL